MSEFGGKADVASPCEWPSSVRKHTRNASVTTHRTTIHWWHEPTAPTRSARSASPSCQYPPTGRAHCLNDARRANVDQLPLERQSWGCCSSQPATPLPTIVVVAAPFLIVAAAVAWLPSGLAGLVGATALVSSFVGLLHGIVAVL